MPIPAVKTSLPPYPVSKAQAPAPAQKPPAPAPKAPQVPKTVLAQPFNIDTAAAGVMDADRAATAAANAQAEAEYRLGNREAQGQEEMNTYIAGLRQSERGELERLDPGSFQPKENDLANIAGIFTMVGMLGAFMGGKQTTAAASNAQAALTGMLKGWQDGDDMAVARQKAIYDENVNYLTTKRDLVRNIYKDYEDDAVKVGIPTAQGRYIQRLITEANADVMATRAKYAGAQATQKQADDILKVSEAMESKQADLDTRVALAQLNANMRWGNGGNNLSPDAISDLVDNFIAGNTSGLSLLGSTYSPAGQANHAAFGAELDRQLKARNLKGSDIARLHAQYTGEMAAQRTLGTQSGRLQGAIGALQETVPLAKEASARVDRTSFPDFNAIEQSVRRGTGDTAIVVFNAYNQALVNDYAQIMKRGGVSTDESSRRANDILSTAYSAGQYEAGIDALNNEASAVQNGLANAKDVIAGRSTGPKSGPKEGDKSKSKSGKPIIFRNGQWEYQ